MAATVAISGRTGALGSGLREGNRRGISGQVSREREFNRSGVNYCSLHIVLQRTFCENFVLRNIWIEKLNNSGTGRL